MSQFRLLGFPLANKRNERNGRKPNTCFVCGSEDHFITNSHKLDTLDKKVHRNRENPKTRAYRSCKIDKMLKNSTDESDSRKIYTSMARMLTNIERPISNYGDSSQLTNWILDSGATFHMTPDINILKFHMGILSQ